MSAHGKSTHPWVQPIIVAKEGTHEDTVLTGAQASFALYLARNDWPNSPIPITCWNDWLSGPFTKTARRASYKDLQKVIAWCEETRVPYEGVEHGDSAAFALPPMRYEDLPRVVARLQVNGTDLPRKAPERLRDEPWPGYPDSADPWVVLHVRDDLTTGKATAQAAHALWKWGLDWLDGAEPTEIDRFVRDGWPAKLHLAYADFLTRLAARPDMHLVHDAGLTEVEPNTLTAVAEGWPHRRTNGDPS